MLALIIPILNAVLGGIIKPFVAAWTDYERTKLTTGEAGFEAAAKSDSAVMQAALAADVQMAAMKVQLYGTLSYRVITLVAGLPPAIHFGLVYIDTILASKAFLGQAIIGVPKLPAPYDTFEWAVVSSFFLVHAVNLGKSNVAAWLGKKS
ncbi:MAG: hypothetical protein ACREC9_05045 [Methylocella sp.]